MVKIGRVTGAELGSAPPGSPGTRTEDGSPQNFNWSDVALHDVIGEGVKGEELGYFQFGGPTHWLVFGPGVIGDFAMTAIPSTPRARRPARARSLPPGDRRHPGPSSGLNLFRPEPTSRLSA